MSRTLIVTADDFGLAEPVNEAIEIAHRKGILTTASLMVTGTAASDAIRRAHRLPRLGVGLHLVLIDGNPALPPEQIPDLVAADGRFLEDPIRVGLALFLRSAVRQQVEAELRAQFQRFAHTGLTLDHVNGHHHFHQHPTIVGLLLRLAQEFKIKSVRLPVEPPFITWRAQRTAPLQRLASWLFSAARILRMKQRLRAGGIECNDYLLGLRETGQMTSRCVDNFLTRVPMHGITEIYFHPATRSWSGRDTLPAHYRYVEEFQALASVDRREWLNRAGMTLASFSTALRTRS